MDTKELAAAGYAAYCDHIKAAYKDTHALPLPVWEAISDTHRAAWTAAAEAITDTLKGVK